MPMFLHRSDCADAVACARIATMLRRLGTRLREIPTPSACAGPFCQGRGKSRRADALIAAKLYHIASGTDDDPAFYGVRIRDMVLLCRTHVPSTEGGRWDCSTSPSKGKRRRRPANSPYRSGPIFRAAPALWIKCPQKHVGGHGVHLLSRA
ncbi:hypothetical protein OH77DRAFT_757544 [Trametes cingulata]|nr:hypothetical protein OH77DRAFT_757544 [Trametes cingulata]